MDKKNKLHIRIMAYYIVVSFLIGLSILVYLIFVFIYHKEYLADFSNFGQIIAGSIGIIFSFMSTIIIYIALYFQIHQIAIQQKEMSYNIEKTNQQSIESTFFQLLKFYNDILVQMKISYNDDGRYIEGKFSNKEHDLQGRECFQYLYEQYVAEYEKHKKFKESSNNEEFRHLAITSFRYFYSSYHYLLDHYFHTIYNILKYLDDNTNSVQDRNLYISILKTQLSSYEQILLFYYGISEFENLNIKGLLDKYKILKGLRLGLIIDINHITYYKKEDIYI